MLAFCYKYMAQKLNLRCEAGTLQREEKAGAAITFEITFRETTMRFWKGA